MKSCDPRLRCGLPSPIFANEAKRKSNSNISVNKVGQYPLMKPRSRKQRRNSKEESKEGKQRRKTKKESKEGKRRRKAKKESKEGKQLVFI